MQARNWNLHKYLIFTLLISFSLVTIYLFSFQAGKEFRVNTYYADNQRYPEIAMDKNGNFVITWESWEQDGSWDGVFAQRFNSKGEAVGTEFQVNTYTENYQNEPAIVMNKKGNFVITWTSIGQDGASGGVFARRFNRKGKAIGKEFRVNTYTDKGQNNPAIALDKKGNFVITWMSDKQDGSGYGIFAKMFKK